VLPLNALHLQYRLKKEFRCPVAVRIDICNLARRPASVQNVAVEAVSGIVGDHWTPKLGRIKENNELRL